MAILMVMDRDHVHSDPEKDQRGSYKRGMIVQIFEDDTPIVIPPAEPFLFIKVKDAPLDDFETWATEQETSTTLVDVGNGVTEEQEIVVRRRSYMIDIESLPQKAQESLITQRYCEV
jgi:hypothetical protein